MTDIEYIQPERSRSREASLSSYLPLLSLLVLTLAIMLPRLSSAQFGLFDDPTTLVSVEKLLSGDPTWQVDLSYGRFRPLYWFYNAGIYALFGKQPAAFFAANSALLFLISTVIYYLVKTLGGNRPQAWMTAALLVISGPVIENTYTLSKQELLQALWLSLFLLSWSLYPSAKTVRRKIITAGFVGLFTLLACLTKETGVILPAVGLGWVIAAWVLERLKVQIQQSSSGQVICLAASVLGVALFFGLRSFSFSSLNLIGQGYGASFTFEPQIILSKVRPWINWLKRDYLFVIPLFLAPLLALLRKRDLPHLQSSINSIIWMAIWLAIYIPWAFSVEYYLLPFAIGMAVLVGNLLWDHGFAVKGLLTFWKVMVALPLAASVIFLIMTFSNNLSNGMFQITTDRSNSEMVDYIVKNASRNSVVLVNIQEPNEYVNQLQRLVNEVEGRSDLKVTNFDFQDLQSPEFQRKDIYFLLPLIDNQFYPTVRTGVDEFNARRWNQLLREHPGTTGEVVFEKTNSFRPLTINQMLLFCPVGRYFGYCQSTPSPFNRTRFEYGWQIIQVVRPIP